MKTRHLPRTSCGCPPPPEMFGELLTRVGARITKQNANYREALDPGVKRALTLRHLARGNKYHSMTYGWRVPHNTISLFIPKVCQAIIDEYTDEVMKCPTTPEEWRAISDKFADRWNFPHTSGALDGKPVNCKCPPNSGSLYYNYKEFYSVVLMALVMLIINLSWHTSGYGISIRRSNLQCIRAEGMR